MIKISMELHILETSEQDLSNDVCVQVSSPWTRIP